MKKYIDIHTHQIAIDNETFSIQNIDDRHIFVDNSNKHYSIGLHPWHLNNDTLANDIQEIAFLADNKNCIAIGECGLDRFVETDFSLQIEVFEKQIQIAEKLNLPIIIHCVRAYSDLIVIKKKLNPKVPLIIHGFNQNSEILAELIKHNFYISIGEAILNINYNAYKHFAKIPLNRLFLETDNSKLSIKLIYKKASEILQITEIELIAIINQNFQVVFRQNI